MRDVNERLLDIQEAIANIMKYTGQGRDSFDQIEQAGISLLMNFRFKSALCQFWIVVIE